MRRRPLAARSVSRRRRSSSRRRCSAAARSARSRASASARACSRSFASAAARSRSSFRRRSSSARFRSAAACRSRSSAASACARASRRRASAATAGRRGALPLLVEATPLGGRAIRPLAGLHFGGGALAFEGAWRACSCSRAWAAVLARGGLPPRGGAARRLRVRVRGRLGVLLLFSRASAAARSWARRALFLFAAALLGGGALAFEGGLACLLLLAGLGGCAFLGVAGFFLFAAALLGGCALAFEGGLACLLLFAAWAAARSCAWRASSSSRRRCSAAARSASAACSFARVRLLVPAALLRLLLLLGGRGLSSGELGRTAGLVLLAADPLLLDAALDLEPLALGLLGLPSFALLLLLLASPGSLVRLQPLLLPHARRPVVPAPGRERGVPRRRLPPRVGSPPPRAARRPLVRAAPPPGAQRRGAAARAARPRPAAAARRAARDRRRHARLRCR